MAIATVPTKTAINCGLSTRRKITISGRLNPTTAIMNANTVPSAAPFSINALTMGMIPAAFEYRGTPKSTAAGTLHHASLPRMPASALSGT